MSKFIITYNEGRLCLMSMDSCTDCPLMKFNKATHDCECRSFFGKDGNYIKGSIAAYDDKTERVYQNVDIPGWCLLSDDIYNMSEHIYNIFKDRIEVLPFGGDVTKLPYVNGFDLEEFENNSDVNVSPYMVATKDIIIDSTPFKSDDELEMDRFFESIGIADEFEDVDLSEYWNKRSYNKPTEKKYTKICSICGKEHESVDRNLNNGVCCDCLLECVDIESKKQAYIKNFRLKREISFTDKCFKILI